ncbi:MBL fold metallo-hydrolase [Spirillospora sp. NBC_01491]|uniref:MBL fold metallo-hydrolase n=1 Tax=Spirillospora sp. NBC_01491 TaxID=2976007 RepID=UPI002E35443C|nr:MBL fold metallo-hydrolase [Spirillospora sp. NBC_01491]
MIFPSNREDVRRLSREAGPRTIRLGDLTVSHVPDGAVRLRPRGWFPSTTGADWDDRPEYLDGGCLVASVGGLLVESGDRALLIDAGVGPVDRPAAPKPSFLGRIHGGALVEGLARAGRAPAGIEAVAITHLHSDHVGWLARPEFAATPVLIAEREWATRDLAIAHGIGEAVLDALAPRVRTVEDGEEIFPGVRMTLMPGHTAGHAVYTIVSGGRRLIAFGDVLHSPAQIEHPEWPVVADHRGGQASAQRAALIAELERPGTLGYGGHFADVVFGRVDRDGDRPFWNPEP